MILVMINSLMMKVNKLQRGVTHVTGTYGDIWGLFKNSSSSGPLLGIKTNTGTNC
jgi:hypothetical protein